MAPQYMTPATYPEIHRMAPIRTTVEPRMQVFAARLRHGCSLPSCRIARLDSVARNVISNDVR